jgi:membrane protein DedA with SNARE-associated domain
MAANHGRVEPEALRKLDRLREVTGGERNLVPFRAQTSDDRPHDERVWAVGEVDPDSHRRAQRYPSAAVYELASVTNALVNVATTIINDLGYPGIFLLLVAGSAGIPVSSEAVMLFAGFDVYRGHFTLVAIILVGILGDLVGASVAYAIGYFGRIELIQRHGAKVHITPERLARAERWFERHGTKAIPICRMLPLVRAYMSFPAGVAEVPYLRFLALSALGGVPWIAFWGILGRAIGSHYHSVQSNLHYVDIAALVLIVAGIVYLFSRRRRSRLAA